MKIQKLDALSSSLADMIFVYSASEGRYLDSFGGADLTLYSPDRSFIGKTVHELLPSDAADAIVRHIGYCMDIKGAVEFDYALDHNQLPNGEGYGIQWYRARVMPMTDSTELYGEAAVTFVSTNITKEKRAEDRLQEFLSRDSELSVPCLVMNAYQDEVKSHPGLTQASVFVSNMEEIKAKCKPKSVLDLENTLVQNLNKLKYDQYFYVGRVSPGEYLVACNMDAQSLELSIKSLLSAALMDAGRWRSIPVRTGEGRIQIDIQWGVSA